MKITGIDLHVLLVPDYDVLACSSAQDDLVVEIHTDEGIVGIGETDTNPRVARECIRARGTHCMGLGLQEMLLGADPMEPASLWDVLQPDIGHVGGFTEVLKVCTIAGDRDRLIVPHCWKSGIGIAASVHLAASCDHWPYIEFLPLELAESPLRRELLMNDFTVVDGKITVPDAPGLGIELNRDVLRKYRVSESLMGHEGICC